MDTNQTMIICPHCGRFINIEQARVNGLSLAARAVWNAGGRRWQCGLETLGPSELAARANISPRAAHYHLSILVGEGLVKRIPQNQFKRVRHVYTGTLKHQTQRV